MHRDVQGWQSPPQPVQVSLQHITSPPPRPKQGLRRLFRHHGRLHDGHARFGFDLLAGLRIRPAAGGEESQKYG